MSDDERGMVCHGCGKRVFSLTHRAVYDDDGTRTGCIWLCDDCTGAQQVVVKGKGRNRPNRFSSSTDPVDGVPYVKYGWRDDHGGRGKRTIRCKYPSKSGLSEEAARETEELASAEQKGVDYVDHEDRGL